MKTVTIFVLLTIAATAFAEPKRPRLNFYVAEGYIAYFLQEPSTTKKLFEKSVKDTTEVIKHLGLKIEMIKFELSNEGGWSYKFLAEFRVGAINPNCWTLNTRQDVPLSRPVYREFESTLIIPVVGKRGVFSVPEVQCHGTEASDLEEASDYLQTPL